MLPPTRKDPGVSGPRFLAPHGEGESTTRDHANEGGSDRASRLTPRAYTKWENSRLSH